MVFDAPDDVDRLLDLLSDKRRRYVLYCLYLYANPMTLPTVADRVTEWEYGVPAEELLEERLRVYTSLYHTHVPKLADAGVVAYSQEEDMIELTDDAVRLRPFLERMAEADLDEGLS